MKKSSLNEHRTAALRLQFATLKKMTAEQIELFGAAAGASADEICGGGEKSSPQTEVKRVDPDSDRE